MPCNCPSQTAQNHAHLNDKKVGVIIATRTLLSLAKSAELAAYDMRQNEHENKGGNMTDKIMRDFSLHSQELREKYGAMKDTAPLLWDLSVWLRRRLKEETNTDV